jgi:hypothetical protein
MGLVLVFDMDQTILDSSDPYLFNRPPTPEARVILKKKIRESLNWNVVNLLKRAAKLRPDGVSAICMLTNNSSTILVSAVDEVLYEETGSKGKYKTYAGNANDREMPDKPYFFDSIMMRQHSSRPKTIDDNPPKRYIDIMNMLSYIGMKDVGIDRMKDVFFFDDIGTHNLRSEFNFMSEGKYKDHYIHITPPYNKLLQDRTDYRPILHSLAALDKQQPELPPLATPLRRGPAITYYRVPQAYGKLLSAGPLPSAGPPPPTPYRPRSNTKVNANNLGLPPPPQEQSLHKKPTISRPSLLGAFARPSTVGTKGGSRKTRKRYGRRRLTRRRK